MKNETTINHCAPPDAKRMLTEVLWNEEKSEDKEFLKRYYQYKFEYWSLKPKHIGGKVAEHWRKALRSLS